MKRILLIAAVLVACIHQGPEKTERGKVVAMSYTPPSRLKGYNTNGDFSYHWDAEKFVVVFRCEHGVAFAIESIPLWAKLAEGDSVTIHFRENLWGDGTVRDYEFIDAKPIR